MQTMTAGYRSISLLVRLNWDKFFYVGTVAAALVTGAAFGALIAG